MDSQYNQDFCMKFNLFDLCNADLKKFLEPVENEKVCVVSIVGKSSFTSKHFKKNVIAQALGRNLENADNTKAKKEFQSLNGDVSGYYDSKNQVIFLNLYGFIDTTYVIDLCKEMEEELKVKSFLEVWSDLQYQYGKVLLLLFILSHIVIIVHPSSSFDMSYVYLFQTLNEIRFRGLPWLREELKNFDISNEWVQAGRPCSPRVLFVFESYPLDQADENEIANMMPGMTKLKTNKLPPLIKLEHSLEDQIYRILRKSRVITNVSGNSLFAIPANQEFVFMFSSKPYISDHVDFFLNQIRLHCQFAKENDSTASKSGSYQRNTPSPVSISSGLIGDVCDSIGSKTERSFGKFLQQHVQVALTKGFDDNVGRHPVPAFFELPTAHTWFQLAARLIHVIDVDDKDDEDASFLCGLKEGLDYDMRFSDAQCRKMQVLASKSYLENLPIHYTEKFHKTKLAYAFDVFYANAKGPACNRYIEQLTEDCDKLWKSGRQMCEVLSLSGNHCINVKHRTENDPDEDKSLQVMPHCSQIKLISACNCGRKQTSRDDPFDVKVANYDFYMKQFSHCCAELEKISFPVFEASTSESHPAHISPVRVPDLEDIPDDKGKELTASNNSGSGSSNAKSESSTENTPASSLANDGDVGTVEDQSQSQVEEDGDEIIISIADGEEPTIPKEKSLIRQPSTTEYLPGMLHSDCPPGLLPLFSSWSLVCVGPSSLYSHNIGLQDQPGFIPGTNFLLPWDVTVKVEHKEKWPSLWEGKRPMGTKGKKSVRDGPQFNVKIFIGVEYECFRGHRFMCSAPDRVLRASSSGLIKENALKVTGSDMPLYFPCPCRPSKPQIAQLMRIHVVTPKAPVHVTLKPRVQPAPDPAPMFFPSMNEPLKLSQSSYWVLRLPFAYVGNQGVYYPPREPVPASMCRLLKGMYNIAEQQSTR